MLVVVVVVVAVVVAGSEPEEDFELAERAFVWPDRLAEPEQTGCRTAVLADQAVVRDTVDWDNIGAVVVAIAADRLVEPDILVVVPDILVVASDSRDRFAAVSAPDTGVSAC